MNNSPELEAFKNAYQSYVEEGKDVPEWKSLGSAAVFRKHTGDLDGAIETMVKAISLTRAVPALSKETATNLNYLADLYLAKNAIEQAEEAIREAIELSRPQYPFLLADNLLILAGIQSWKGAYEKALVSAEESLHLSQKQDDSYGIAQAEEIIRRIENNSE